MLSIFKEIKKYLETKYNITRLDVTEKVIVVITLILQVLIFLILLSVFLFILSLALANYLGECLNNTALGFLCVAGIYAAVLLILFVFKKPLVINPLNKMLIHLLLTSQKEEENDEDEDNEI